MKRFSFWHAGDIVRFMTLCRVNDVPAVWVYTHERRVIYRGRSIIARNEAKLSSGVGIYRIIIRDRDVELIKLLLGRIAPC